MGPEDDPQVPRGPGRRLYAVLEGWTGFQCHHSQKQVRLIQLKGFVILVFKLSRFSKPLMLFENQLLEFHHLFKQRSMEYQSLFIYDFKQ